MQIIILILKQPDNMRSPDNEKLITGRTPELTCTSLHIIIISFLAGCCLKTSKTSNQQIENTGNSNEGHI